MRTATRDRLVIFAFLAALALPIAYSLFVRDGWFPRGWFLATVVGIWLVQFVRDRRMLGRHSGDERKGLTIFVEPVAWTGLKWAEQRRRQATGGAMVITRGKGGG